MMNTENCCVFFAASIDSTSTQRKNIVWWADSSKGFHAMQTENESLKFHYMIQALNSLKLFSITFTLYNGLREPNLIKYFVYFSFSWILDLLFFSFFGPIYVSVLENSKCLNNYGEKMTENNNDRERVSVNPIQMPNKIISKKIRDFMRMILRTQRMYKIHKND